MDKIDLQIASLVTEDARISYRKIANQLGISTNQVIRRCKKLKDLLVFPTVVVDLQKIGFTGWAFFLLNVKHNVDRLKFKQKILQIPNIVIFVRFLGKYNTLVGGPFKDYEHFLDMKNKILKIEEVVEIDYVLDEPGSSWPPNFFNKIIQKELKALGNSM